MLKPPYFGRDLRRQAELKPRIVAALPGVISWKPFVDVFRIADQLRKTVKNVDSLVDSAEANLRI